MTLTEFLLARIAEDEKAALPFRNRLGEDDAWRCDEVGGKVRSVMPQHFGNSDVMAESDTHLTAAHIARHDPARVLAECEAKRRIVDLHGVEQSAYDEYAQCGTCLGVVFMATGDVQGEKWPCATLCTVALPYSDHPDYDQAWRP